MDEWDQNTSPRTPTKRNDHFQEDVSPKRRRRTTHDSTKDCGAKTTSKISEVNLKEQIQISAQSQAQAYLQADKEGHERQRSRREALAEMNSGNATTSEDQKTDNEGNSVQEGYFDSPGKNTESYASDGSPDGFNSDMKPFQCDIVGCDRRFKKLNGLISHQHVAHAIGEADDPKPFKCSVPGCDKAYRNSNGLAYHLENGHGGGTVSSPRTPTPNTAKPSREQGTVEKQWYCPYKGCGRTYKNLKGLVYHLQKGKGSGHPVPTPKKGDRSFFVCAVPDCDKTFKNPQGLVAHVDSVHADMEPIESNSSYPDGWSPQFAKVECPSCMRQFKGEKGLAQHVTLVHKRKHIPLNAPRDGTHYNSSPTPSGAASPASGDDDRSSES
ncbi:hypothetical protein DFS34DRAFT_649205 [Phlyctochytrium arcticum]|nr:hypothetical protein DFS34DRAFT_649205 [Phlyctochytrium arcticum]